MEAFLCRLGGCWSPEKSKDNSGSQGQDRHTAGCTGQAESEHMVLPSLSEPMWSSVPCPPYVWVTLGQERTLAITLSSPIVSQTAWLQTPCLGCASQPWVGPRSSGFLQNVIWLRTLTLTAGPHSLPSLQPGWMLLRCHSRAFPLLGTLSSLTCLWLAQLF